jgi:asparagine synthetase B (glutamine-hydrolysing)
MGQLKSIDIGIQKKLLRKYARVEDYSEELLELFLKAVKSRIPDNGLVTSMLSGGLDSGAVVSLAAKVLAAQGKSLTTFSHVPLYRELLEAETKFTFLMKPKEYIILLIFTQIFSLSY